MHNTKKYNGYANWATWDFHMISNNDYNLYNQIRDVVSNNLDDKAKVIQFLRNVASDDYGVDYYNVDFSEVAETWINDIKDELYNNWLDNKVAKWEVYVADENGKKIIMKVAESKRAGVILYNKLINSDNYHEVGMRVVKESVNKEG